MISVTSLGIHNERKELRGIGVGLSVTFRHASHLHF